MIRLQDLHLMPLIVTLAVGGCALKVDQDKEVATYRQVVDQGQRHVTFTPDQPLSLEDALALANQYNEQIGLQGESYLQSLIARDRAAASFMPQISLVPLYYEQQSPGTATGSGRAASVKAAAAVSKNSWTDVPVNGRMNVFNGFQDVNNYRSAERTIDQRRALLLDAQASVLVSVANNYYQVLRSERSVAVLENSLALQDERVRDIRARQKAGIARPLDVAQTEAQASATRVQWLAAKNDVLSGRSILVFLVAQPVGRSPLLDEARIPQVVPGLDELQAIAARNRQDLAADVAAVQAAKFAVEAAIGQYYPSVTFNVNYFLSRQSIPTESQWNYLLSANLPIFTAGIIEANVRTAWSFLRQAKLSEQSTRRQVVQGVELAYQNLQSSQERLRELQVQVTAAAEALRQAEQSYRVGLATNLERLTAQDQLLSAQLQLASEQYNFKVFYLNLLRALGTLSTRLPGEKAPTTMPVTQPVTLPATVAPATAPAVPTTAPAGM